MKKITKNLLALVLSVLMVSCGNTTPSDVPGSDSGVATNPPVTETEPATEAATETEPATDAATETEPAAEAATETEIETEPAETKVIPNPDAVTLFGEWSDNFAPGKRSGLHTLTVEKMENGYTQSRGEVEIAGVRTYATVDRAYSPAMHVHVDGYMVDANYAAGYKAAGYEAIGLSGSFNKTKYSTLKRDILQVNRAGNGDGLWDSVVLTEEVVAYNIKSQLAPMMKESNWVVGYVEPEMFRDGLYGKGYKELWEAKYGEPWSNPIGTPRSIFMSQRLNVWSHANAIRAYSDYLLANPGDQNLKFYIAPHSTLAYATYGAGITDGYVHMMGTGRVGAVTGQTWSNTIENPIRYEGKKTVRSFVNAVVDYGTYLDAADYYGADFYALCDPMSDTYTTKSETYWRNLCHEQLVASLMYPEINRWEFIWTNRAYMNVSADYRSEQTAIHNAMLEISGAPYKLMAGTPGITYLLGDTLTWQASQVTRLAENAYDGFWGVTAPLIYDGILMRTRAMELVTSAKDLEGVSLLIVSYDNQKPLYENVNEAIAEWVKAGGTLLLLGGPDEYLNIEEAWWNADGKGGSPTANLLMHLGVDTVTAEKFNGAKTGLNWRGSEITLEDNSFKDGSMKVGGDAFTYAFTGSGYETILETEDGTDIGIRFAAGKGSVVMAGLSTTDYGDSKASADLLRMLTAEALRTTDYPYTTSHAFVAERGEYTAVYAISEHYQLKGVYVNMFSPDLKVETDPVVKKGQTGLYRRILTDGKSSQVLFAGGFVQDVKESAEMTEVTLYAAENALVPIRIAAPDGKIPTSVEAIYESGTGKAARTWDEESGTLLVSASSTPTTPVTVRVTWSTTGEAVKNTTYETVLDVKVNSAGRDKEYLVSNTGNSNDLFRFCDKAAEIVWCFDIAEYEGLIVSVGVVNNYIIEVSGDNETYQTIVDYSTFSSTRAAGTNDSVVTILPDACEGVDGKLYIRLRNTDVKLGWGGSIKFFTFRALKEQ